MRSQNAVACPIRANAKERGSIYVAVTSLAVWNYAASKPAIVTLLMEKLGGHRLRGGHDPLTFGQKLPTRLNASDAAANPPAITTSRTQISPAGGKSLYFASPEIASPAFLAVSPTLLAAEVTAASRRFSAPPRLNR